MKLGLETSLWFCYYLLTLTELYIFKVFLDVILVLLLLDLNEYHMRQSIQEWTKLNLWETAFKKFEVIWSA